MKQSLEPVVAVVDDDDSLRRSLANLLRSAGFGAQTYASAESFIATVRLETLACVLLDLRLPGMSGLELADELRTSRPGLAVIILSAQSDAATRKRCLEAGVAGVLAKPFLADELLRTLRGVMERS